VSLLTIINELKEKKSRLINKIILEEFKIENPDRNKISEN
tara:strand:+ start:262 stop:381 length:120 start_codon:yes stop_codon:yes gene_type:complete